MKILGLNAFHGDSSACIFNDTQLIAATEEERINRIKHWAGLPIEAIKFCLNEAGIGLEEVDVITISRDPKAKLRHKIIHAAKGMVGLKTLIDRGRNSLKVNQVVDDIRKRLGVNKEIKAKLVFVEHHRSHMASAFHVSPFDKAAILSIDGMGDFTSTMRGTGVGTTVDVIDSVSYPNSLGYVYTMFTQFLGFPHYGDEYKVMGLAPYGTPRFTPLILNNIIEIKENGLFSLNSIYFKHFKEGIDMAWDDGSPSIEPLFNENLEQLIKIAPRKGGDLTKHHMDIAASVQKATEVVIFELAETLFRKTNLPSLCLTGGVAQNSVANGKLVRNTSFKRLFVPPAGHDAGTAVGSALYYIHHQLQKPRNTFQPQPYTGVQFNDDEIQKQLTEQRIDYSFIEDAKLFQYVAQKLTEGKVIGWFQGRAEFGPRALGNRSILVDPRRTDAKALLNDKIKKRESFRPFAPSILKEYVTEYFVQQDDVPFMEKVFDIREEKHKVIPAVTHENGTGRLQTVDQNVNWRYHALISAFHKLTDVPVLLNTSFNENEPIVNTPEHAINCYQRTKMDILVLGNCIIER